MVSVCLDMFLLRCLYKAVRGGKHYLSIEPQSLGSVKEISYQKSKYYLYRDASNRRMRGTRLLG